MQTCQGNWVLGAGEGDFFLGCKENKLRSEMTQPFSLLPFMPFDPAWIEQGEAFRHPDARMLKASMKLLFAAWRGAPVASIPSSHSYIAEVTGLPPELVAERYVALTDGFVLQDDGRLHHTGLAHVCSKMQESYGAEIDGFTVSLAVVAQDPEQFSLIDGGKSSSKLKGKTLIPKGFGLDSHPGMRAWCFENGYPAPNQQKWLMEKFIDYAVARDDKQKDWVRTFYTYARNELAYRKYPPDPIWPEGVLPMAGGSTVPGAVTPIGIVPSRNTFANLARARPSTMPSRGEQALDHNRSVMDTALANARPPAQRGG